jgi:hypothetical protein
LSINLVVLDGVAQHVALRYDEHSRPELRFTLEQVEHATDGKPWTLYLPCVAVGSAAERLAGELEDGEHIILTSTKLCYRKRSTKLGEQSRMEILVWTVDRLTELAQDERTDPDEGRDQGNEPPMRPEPNKGRPRYPKWKPEPAASN